MKKIYLLFLSVLTVTFCYAQPLTGTKNIPADYPTLAAALLDLNSQGVGAGGVTINLNQVETAPAGGYVIGGAGSLVLTTSSNANQIIINGNGFTVTAPSPQTSGNLNDAIFKLIGADWVTINGFTMRENVANTTTAAGTNNMTEWGVALLYVTATDGAQNDKISNNNISLDRTYQNTFGIYANATHTVGSISTSATATGAAGGNSGLKVYSNLISNVNNGIVVVGPTAAVDNNNGIDIGGASSATGNSITNYGTTGTFSGYANVSGTVNGILVRNSTSANISFNTISSSVGGVTGGTLNGIQIPASTNAPTITFTTNINNNIISLQSGLAGGAMNGINIPSGSASATSTLNINNNDFNTFGHTVAATGAITFILTASVNQFTNITGNTFTNITVNTTGTVLFMSHGYSIPATGQLIMSNNSIVTGFTRTSAGALTISTSNSTSGTGSVCNYINNNFSNITLTGASTVLGFNNTDGGAGSTKTVTGNTFNNWSGTTNAITCMNFTYWNGVSSLSNNTITNISGQSSILGVVIGSTANNATSISVSGNTINNLTSSGTGGTVTGLSCANTSPLISITGNKINTLSSTGASAVSGIIVSGAGAAGTSVFKNNIYNLSGSNASSTVNGISVSAGTLINVYNNFVSDLRAPAANASVPVYGINNSGGTNIGIYYNTIALGKASTVTSSGANFGLTGIGYSSTSNVTLRNNIVWVDATPAGTGTVAAVRRSAAGVAGTAPAVANFNSNNNIYNVILGGGNLNKYLYVEGTLAASVTNGYGIDIGQADVPLQNLVNDPSFNSSCGKYKNFMGGRESGTFNEDDLTASGSPNFTFVPSGTCYASNSGQVIASPSVTDDYNSVARSATPDLGALEFTAGSIDASPPTINFTPLTNGLCLTNRVLNATISDPISGVNVASGLRPRLYFRKGGAVAEADVFGNYPTDNNNTFNGWKYVEATGTEPNFTFTIDYSLLTSPMALGDSITYFVIAQDLNTTPNVGKNTVVFPAAFCPSSVLIPSSGAVPTSGSLGYKIAAVASYTTVADGDWNNPATWGGCGVPTFACGSTIPITINNNVTVTTAGLTADNVTVAAGKTLTITSGDLTLGCSSAAGATGASNYLLSVDGTLTVNGGTLNVNGGISLNSTATFNMSSGVINVDPNDGTLAGSFAGVGNGSFFINTPTLNVTGGAINILDPMYSGTAGTTQASIAYSHASIDAVWGPGCTVTLGGGDDQNPANTNGFYVECNISVGTLEIGNLVVNGGLYNNVTGSRCMSTRQASLIYITKVRNLTINSGSELLLTSGSSVCAVTGSIVNNGLITNAATAVGNTGLVFAGDAQYSGGVTFYPGTIAQSITGSGYFRLLPTDPIPTSQTGNLVGSLIVYQLKTAPGLTLGMPLTVDGSLRLWGGKVITTSTNILALGHGTSLPGTAAVLTATMGTIYGTTTTAPTTAAAYDGGHIVGPFNRWVTATTTSGQQGIMPVGSDTSRPAQISFTAAPTTPGYLKASWTDGTSSDNVSPTLTQAGVIPPVISYSLKAHWNIDNPGTLTGGTYTISVNDKNANSVLSFANTVLLKRASAAVGTAWEDDGAGGPIGTHVPTTGSNTSPVAGRSGLTTFSRFALGAGLGVVPVSIEYFRGSKLSGSNYLSWKVDCTSSPSITLVLERSSDGRRFSQIQSLDATATRCLQDFNYTDGSPLSGINYYRLKMITPDGAFRYSVIVALLNRDKGFELISLAPNPVKNTTVLNISSVKGGKLEIAVTDMNGRSMMKTSTVIIAGNNPINMDFSTLGAGTYRITAINADLERKTIQLVKY